MVGGGAVEVQVAPGATSAARSYAYDDPDALTSDDLKFARSGVEGSFIVVAVDKFGCKRGTGGESVAATVQGPGYTVTGAVEDTEDGSYRIRYTAPVPGNAQLNVTLGGEHIGSDPSNVPLVDGCGDALGHSGLGSPFALVVGRPGSLLVNTTGYAEANHSVALEVPGGNFTASAWVQPLAHSGGFVVSKATATAGYAIKLVEVTTLIPGANSTNGTNATNGMNATVTKLHPSATVYVGGTAYAATSGVPLETGKWVHLALTFNSTALALLVEGSVAAVKVMPSTGLVDVSAAPALEIGKGLVGLLDEVQVYSTVLTPKEVTAAGMCPADASEVAPAGLRSSPLTRGTVTPPGAVRCWWAPMHGRKRHPRLL